MKNATHELFAIYIYKMMQASKANESVSEYSKTGLCITVTEDSHESNLNVTGVPIFSVTNLNRNRTQFRPSVIHYQPDQTE